MTPNELVNANCRFIEYQVRKYLRRWPTFEHVAADLRQEAYDGALYAAHRYDPTRGASYITYAAAWIDEFLKRAALRQGGPIVARGRKGWDRLPTVPLEDVDHTAEMATQAPYDAAGEGVGVYRRAYEEIAERLRLEGRHRAPARDAEIFLEYEFTEATLKDVAVKHGLSHQRVKQVVQAVRPVFDEWASEIRREAA